MERFATDPALRLLAGFLFFGLFTWSFFRFSRGLGKALFVLFCGALAGIFILSPAAQLLAFPPLLAFFGYTLLHNRQAGQPYQPAVALVESGGIKRGLTAPEAAVLLELPLPHILAVVLVGLLKKGILQVEAGQPLALEVDPEYRPLPKHANPDERAAHRRQVAQKRGVVLYPYEEPFLEALQSQAGMPLAEVRLAAPTRALVQQVARRVRGHDLEGTRAYYRTHLGRARHDLQVAPPGAPAERAQEQFLEWMLLDEDIAGLFTGYRRPWVAALNGETQGDVTAAVRRLVSLLAGAVPSGALQVRWGAGEQHAIGGEDEVTAAYLSAVISQLK